jgi:CRISPR-associated protein Cas1
MDERRGRPLVVRRMYARRMGIIMPHRDITVLRGIEGARVKSLYARLATKYGIEWHGRVYDRMDPGASDDANQALNHAASAVEGAAAIAVYATATIPQLGFVHEDSGQSFVLDIADLYRDRVTVPCAFRAVAEAHRHPHMTFERVVRKLTGATLRKEAVIASMIDDIKALFAEAERPEHPASSQTPNDEGAITRDSSDDDLQSEPA